MQNTTGNQHTQTLEWREIMSQMFAEELTQGWLLPDEEFDELSVKTTDRIANGSPICVAVTAVYPCAKIDADGRLHLMLSLGNGKFGTVVPCLEIKYTLYGTSGYDIEARVGNLQGNRVAYISPDDARRNGFTPMPLAELRNHVRPARVIFKWYSKDGNTAYERKYLNLA